eukprot:4012232-Amphidinium_carterae.1
MCPPSVGRSQPPLESHTPKQRALSMLNQREQLESPCTHISPTMSVCQAQPPNLARQQPLLRLQFRGNVCKAHLH